MNPRPHVLLIAGPNGAGKTSAAPGLVRDLLGVAEYVNADLIAQGLSAFALSPLAVSRKQRTCCALTSGITSWRSTNDQGTA
ncbi:MAG: hypothetical protein WBJ41_03170 [Chromatiaceae bacterium]